MDCGYRNLANFNRRFRQVTSMTPSEYRSKFRGAAGGR
jgi:AraC-like DNA-binding protein